MMVPVMFAEPHAPDVMRAIASSIANRPSVQRTLRREQGEGDDAFYARAQREAFGLWLNCKCEQAVHLECVYRVPSEATYFDDERANTKRALLCVIVNETEKDETRVAAAAIFVCIFGPTGYR